MFRRKRWTAAGALAGPRMRHQSEMIDMTFTASGSGPARRRARYVAGGVVAAGLMAAAAVGSGATGAAAAVTPGSLDTAFGTGGIVTTNLTALGVGGEEGALQEPNGDILVALNQGMLRFLPNGQLDTSFGTNGLATGILVQGANALAVQPNGQIITSGVNLAGPATSPIVGITRLNANGTVDTTFGTDGTTTIPVTLAGRATAVDPTAVLVQPDGKILVTGSSSVQTGRRSGITDGVVARLNANGTLDTTFGIGGSALITANQFPTGLGLDASGDIFALPGQSQLQTQQGVTELSSSGQLDATVTPEPLTATSAGATFDPTNEQFVYARFVSPNGSRILLDAEIQRFTTAGTVASSTGAFTFAGTSGSVRSVPSAVAVLPNGQALVIGTQANGPTSAAEQSAVVAFARSNPDGTLDSTFGTGGTALTNVSLGGNGFGALFPQSDGTAIAVGVGTISSTQSGLVIARFNL
jgi:uncharacterized delta-60 repeat protein